MSKLEVIKYKQLIKKRINEFLKSFPKFKNKNITLKYPSMEEGYVFTIDGKNYIDIKKLETIYNVYLKENNIKAKVDLDLIIKLSEATLDKGLIIIDDNIQANDLNYFDLNIETIIKFRQKIEPVIVDNLVYTFPLNISKYKLVNDKLCLTNPILPIFVVSDNYIPFLKYIDFNFNRKVVNIFPEKYSNLDIMNYINKNKDEFAFDKDITLNDITIIGNIKSYALLNI